MIDNYERLEAENRRLRQRVSNIEHEIVNLHRIIYQLKSEIKGQQIADFLNNYKPKNISNGL